MRIGIGVAEATERKMVTGANNRSERRTGFGSDSTGNEKKAWLEAGGYLLGILSEEQETEGKNAEIQGEQTVKDRGEAAKIYKAAVSGGRNPVEEIRTAPKVPYGYLAKEGAIIYEGVTFVCDEKTNSICLGDMSDEKAVLNIPLSGGGHLKVNRDNLGSLSQAIGMFSPEDINLIMRAIAQDTKVQSMQKELEDMEADVGEQLVTGRMVPKDEETL